METKMKPYYDHDGIIIINAHVLDALIDMETESIQCCVTSPPYWGLRDYGLEPQIWEDTERFVSIEDVGRHFVYCEHVWGGEFNKIIAISDKREDEHSSERDTLMDGVKSSQGQFCQQCGAWKGSLGLEPTPELYIKHMTDIFREVRRVLRKDGTLWLNLGDSYTGSMKGVSGDKVYGGNKQRTNAGSIGLPVFHYDGLKPKDLIGIPWRVALALQADGWWLRSDIIWCLSGGTKVYAKTQKGEFPSTLKDLYRLKPETVKLWNGEKWSQISGMSKHERKGDEIELVLRSGERISSTPNHKWPIADKLVDAKNLKVGDILDRCFLPESTGMKVNLPQGYPSYIPNNIGWFIGLYLAEGSRDSSGTIQIASHIKEIERFDRLSKLSIRYVGTCRKHQTSENGMTICMDGKILNSIIDTYIAGRTAKDKHLSNECWKRDNNFLHELLRGYLDGDGHWDESNKRWRIGFTRNYNLESDLRTLCSRLACNITCNLSKSYIGDKKYDSFKGEIRFEHTAKGHWNQKNKGEIVEIRKARARYFYGVGVEDEPHLFALASGILTHNSKPNPMPESVTDRPTKAHEYMFLLTKSAKYYYDADAVREGLSTQPHSPGNRKLDISRNDHDQMGKIWGASGFRNKRSVWTIPTENYYVEIDGRFYKVSLDCPIHSHCLYAQNQQREQCGEQLNSQENHNLDKSNHPDQGLVSESSTTLFPDGEKSQIKPSNGHEQTCENISENKTSDPSQTVEPENHPHILDNKERSSCNSGYSVPDDELIATSHNKKKSKNDVLISLSDKPLPDKQRHIVHKLDQSSITYTTAHCTCQEITIQKSSAKTDVWTMPTRGFPEAHFAVFPPKLIEPCIKAGTKIGDIVLDPFGGSGTTAKVAKRFSRKAVLIELNPEYADMPVKHLAQGTLPFK